MSKKPRELKQEVPAQIMDALTSAADTYGALRKLSKAARIEYNTLHLMVKNGTATPKNINKAAKALKIAA